MHTGHLFSCAKPVLPVLSFVTSRTLCHPFISTLLFYRVLSSLTIKHTQYSFLLKDPSPPWLVSPLKATRLFLFLSFTQDSWESGLHFPAAVFIATSSLPFSLRHHCSTGTVLATLPPIHPRPSSHIWLSAVAPGRSVWPISTFWGFIKSLIFLLPLIPLRSLWVLCLLPISLKHSNVYVITVLLTHCSFPFLEVSPCIGDPRGSHLLLKLSLAHLSSPRFHCLHI